MKYKTVIFDFDGTILDSRPGIASSMQLALADYGIEESRETIGGLIGPPLTKTILVRYGLTEQRRDEIMAAFYRHQKEHGLYDTKVYSGVPEMLRELRDIGLKTALATNKPEPSLQRELDHYGLRRWFDAIECNNVGQTRGTKSDFVLWALRGCGAAPAEAVMVGDRANDIQGGLDNGLDTIGVLYGYGSREELAALGPTHIVSSPAEVVEIVKGS